MTTRVLFVCLGNICRSPTAQGVFERRAREVGLHVDVDSAGTSAYHVGEPPDPRSVAAAAARGYDLSAQRSRQVRADDFQRFDFMLAMDARNLSDLSALAPKGARAQLGLFLDYATAPPAREVPDPYYGGPSGFDDVIDLIELASDGLIEALKRAP